VPSGVRAVLIVGYRGEAATERAALTMWSVTTCGWEIMITCEPSTSTMRIRTTISPRVRSAHP
jgi:hypothetical protein